MQLFQVLDRFLPRRLQVKLSLLVTILLLFLVSLVGVLFSDSAETLLQEHIGQKAIEVSSSIALNTTIIQGVLSSDSRVIQPVTEKIREATGAEYIVVGDKNGIRLSHPVADLIGKKFVGGDEGDALLHGKSYASQAIGTLGPSLRGIVPVRDDEENIIGFVAVGYLTRDIEVMIHSKHMDILKYVGIVLVFGIFGATLIARGLKSAIMGLEVHEIATLFHERNAIISAIREGIIAIDSNSCITVVNQAARQYLGEPMDVDFRGRPLTVLCDSTELVDVLKTGENIVDQEIILNDKTMILSIMQLDHLRSGQVASFRPKDELDRLESELSQMQEYSGLMRAQTHEYSNKLHTIGGLLQLGAHQEALDLVMHEASGYQELIHTLAESVPDPVLAGVILGKYNRACEMKINLEFDAQNSFVRLSDAIDREPLVTILGNILDNAFEAVAAAKSATKTVRLYLTDLGPDLIIEVEDSGPGVPKDMVDTLFQSGVTSKNGRGRGTGLSLVVRAVRRLDGQVTFGEGELGGALFTVIIPNQHNN